MRVLHSFLLCLGLLGLVMMRTELSAQSPLSTTESAYDLDWRSDGLVLAVAASDHLWLLAPQFQSIAAYHYPASMDTVAHPPQSVEWSPDGMWIAVILREGWLLVWSYPAGELVFEHQLTERNDPDTIRWHPTQPILSTYRHIINIETGTIEQPYIFDWRGDSSATAETGQTGKVFWSPDGKRLIRSISEANCSPCSEYGIFDTASEMLVQSLGTSSGAWDSFIWSADGRQRKLDHVLINDLIFDSHIERLVYVETGAFENFRMPAMFVVNTFEDQDVINHQVIYPASVMHIDWMPNQAYMITALDCVGEILKIDIRDLSVLEKMAVFAPYPQIDDSPCRPHVFPGYANP